MKKIKKILIIILIFIIGVFPIKVFSRYYQKNQNIKLYLKMAEPIIKVEPKQNTIIKKVNANTQIEEYHFIIKNYDIIDNNKKISEVGFSFNVEIKSSNNQFPIRYEIFDCLSEKEIMQEDNKTSNISINKNEEFERCYKLCLKYDKEKKSKVTNEIDIVVNIEQEM